MRPTALLVDDDPTTLLALPGVLNHKIPRLRVETTTDVTDALARLDVRPYSVVLTDLRMPRMNGLTFLREAKRRQADTPVVLMTGLTDRGLASEAIEAGAFDFLRKPLDRDDLATTIQLALTASHLLRDIKASQQRLSRYAERLDRLPRTMPAKRADVSEFASNLLGESHLLRNQARKNISKSKLKVELNRVRLAESRKRLEHIRRMIRERGQERSIRYQLQD